MKVFISWSGPRSKAVALALREWLRSVIQTVKPWMSEQDIEAGARWNREVDKELGDTKFGIICLTRNNQTAPWLLFETGALAKTIDETYVCPYLIDLEPSHINPGPLTQFQAKRANKKETWELVSTMNKALKENALTEEQLKKTFELWWPELENTLKDLPSDGVKEKRRPLEDMVEEMLGLVRNLSRPSAPGTNLGDIRRLIEEYRNLNQHEHSDFIILEDSDTVLPWTFAAYKLLKSKTPKIIKAPAAVKKEDEDGKEKEDDKG